MTQSLPYVTDLALAQRLERAEAKASAAFVESRARDTPTVGAEWRAFSGTYAMFDGVGSPLSQTFGLGLFSPPTNEGLAEIEAFFHEHGADVFHEVSPLADPALLGIFAERGYHPVELTSVMHMRLTEEPRIERPRPPELAIRPIEPGEETMWAETAARGWSETPELSAFINEFGNVSARAHGSACFIAEWAGQPVASAALAIHDGVAHLAGASTDPAFRGRGAQGALLSDRLRYAAAMGCDIALMGAAPGSPSQRNGERQGFRIAYTRIKWHLSPRA
jgi:GNAT superfamily N-acetyltransferase